MQLDPAALERERDACAKFLAAASHLEERRVDKLDVDPSALHQLDDAGDLDRLAGGGFRVAEGGAAACFMRDR
ncbi:hypothetical protein [Bradyrhizobium guangdongense]|uniref:hypothetical protein n=1 Tax=Bradyrhizobium guangdongense TaxID=1325090 RepID=UPI0013E8AE42|nr:hypothetical protein [Bradyrhizobium guangdongense]